MKLTGAAVLTCLMVCLLLPFTWFATPRSAAAAEPSGSAASVAVLRSDPQAIELEFEVAGYSLRTVSAGGREYNLLEVAGLGLVSDEGAPQVPVQGALVGIPPGAQVALEILAIESEELPGRYDLLPGPTLQVALAPPDAGATGPATLPRFAGQRVVPDEAVYGTDAFFPGEIVHLGEPASLRSQRLVAIQFYPVQVNPASGQVVFYRRVRVRLNIALASPTPGAWAPVPEPEAFESVLAGTLLNYASARAWRLPQAPSPVAAAAPQGQLDAPTYRLVVDRDGIYQVTHAALEAAWGGPLGTVDADMLELYCGGQEVTIRVLDEGGDGSFGPGDSVLFYGQGYTSKYTRENVYWLTYGQPATLPMGQYDGTPESGYDHPSSTESTVHREENIRYWGLMPGDDDLERFYWTYASAGGTIVDEPSLGQVAGAAGEATLRLIIIGYTDEPGLTLDHHVEVYVNDHPDPVGDLWWGGVSREIFDVNFPHSYLQTGANQVRLEFPGDTGAENELNLLDSFEVTYQHAYQAAGNQLRFFGGDPGQDWEYAVTGFTAGDPGAYEVYDITDPTLPLEVTGIGLDDNGDGTYTLRFEDSRQQPAEFWAQTAAGRLSPLRVELDKPSDLTAAGADQIIISHGDFLSAMEPLQQHRGGLLVDVQDVYDEFAYGRREPGAIRDFLAFAYTHWGTSYALLVGDGHFDPNDYLGQGRTNFIPAYLADVDPWLGEVPTDNWYADTQGDKLPEIHIGRLTANTAQEAEAAVDKILAYEALAPASWMSHTLFVADNSDSGGNFPALSDAVIADHLPADYVVHRAYLGQTCASAAACKAQILARIDEGQLITHYIGHAQVEYWAFEKMLQRDDVASMANGPKLPVFLPFTCQEGAFHYPYVSSAAFAETVVMAPAKGAIASWSPTGFGVVTGHDYLDRGFLDAVFHQGQRIIGGATLAGKLQLWASGSNLDLIDTYLLFGDPALRMNAPGAGPHVVYLPLVTSAY